MDLAWYLYRFDYARFLAIRPALRVALTGGQLAELARNEEGRAIAEALAEGELDAYAARQTFLHVDCCLGEPVEVDRHFAHEIAAMVRRRGEEDAGVLLSDLFAGGKNMERWLGKPDLLLGFLTPDDTRALLTTLLVCSNDRHGAQRRRRRRGGLVGAIASFLRILTDNGPPAEDTLAAIRELAKATISHGDGLAVISA